MTSYKNILTSFSEELLRTVEAGYDLVLYFHGRNVRCESDPEVFDTINVDEIRLCHALQCTIYKMRLSDGRKGFALNPWKQDNDE